MIELKDRIKAVLGTLQLAGLATVTESGNPWVRYVMIQGDDDLTLRSATLLSARKVDQIEKNPEVHITCGITNPAEMKPYLQIQGLASIITAEAERHAFWNPSLAPIFSGPDDPRYAVVVIKPYRIECCTPPNMESEVLEVS